MTIAMLGAKATAILAIIGCISFASTYANNILSSYALASDLNRHIADSERFQKSIYQSMSDRDRQGLEDDIRAVEQEAEILQAVPELSPRESLRLKQLENNKGMLLRRLDKVNRR